METREQQLVMILADISGYTKFMVENQLAAVHGQLCITFLSETILREVNIPLHLQGIEGDAVFLYAANPGDDQTWREMLTQVRTKLARFFEVFIEAMITAGEASPCKCAICRNGKDLKLKVIVHSGRAVFNTIAGLPQVSGTDVILAHRLLKNSVPSHEYLLMTEAAYRDLGREMGGNFVKGQETCEGFGPVTTYVQFMGEAAEHARDALYSLPSDALVARARRYWKWVVFGHSCALIAHIRQPVTKSGWLRRAGFIVWQTVTLPLRSLFGLIVVPRRLLSLREARTQTGRQPPEAGASIPNAL
jgi:Protein of unknown function (DUF2652)